MCLHIVSELFGCNEIFVGTITIAVASIIYKESVFRMFVTPYIPVNRPASIALFMVS
ncbi:hypothetical protein D3C71_1923300 [compost metagenome]